MSITQRGANLLLDVLTGRAQSQSPAYAALSSTKPNTDGSNFTEPTQSEYARVLLGTYSGTVKLFGAASEGKTNTTGIVYFPEARSTYERQLYIGICNSSSVSAATSLMQYSPILVTEYMRSGAEQANAATLVYDKQNDRYAFLGKVNEVGGDYEFTFNGTSWQLDGGSVNLVDYGIELSASVTPTNGDILTVYFGIEPKNKTIPIVRAGAWTIQMY